MAEELRIELTEEEGSLCGGLYRGVAVTFIVDAEKNVIVTEEWDGSEEGYGDSSSVTVPHRVWALALPWIAERTATNSK